MSTHKFTIEIKYHNLQEPREAKILSSVDEITLYLDPIDVFTFGIIPEGHITNSADINSLVASIKNTIGGKILLLVPSTIQPYLSQHMDTDFFSRVMYLQNKDIFKTKVNHTLQANYSITVDKNLLLERAEDISQLLINHADWAGKYDHKRRLYGTATIKARLDDPHVEGIALLDQNKIIGFGRVYILDNYFGYFSDIVIDENYRGQGLMTAILQHIQIQANTRHAEYLILIAGTTELIATYTRFGFTLAETPGKVLIRDKVLIGYGLPPAQALTQYHSQFSIPQCPVKYQE